MRTGASGAHREHGLNEGEGVAMRDFRELRKDMERMVRDMTTRDDGADGRLHDVATSYRSGLWDGGIRYGIDGTVDTGTESYARLWTRMVEKQDSWERIPFGTRIYVYRFRRAEVSRSLHEGDVFDGRVRVGVERTPDSQGIPSERLDVVIYGTDGTPLAKVSSRDWSAGDIRMRIGDVPEMAMLFCDTGGCHGYMFLYMVAAWYSDVHPYRFDVHRCVSDGGSVFITVDAPEALSDLTAGEAFHADLTMPSWHDDERTLGIARRGSSHPFARLPRAYSDACSELERTGYRVSVPCVNHGSVMRGKGYECMVEVRGRRPEEMRRLAMFRRDSGLDVTFAWGYETMRLGRVERPYQIPFGPVTVEYAAVPIPHRKNPVVELRVGGVVIDSARYGDKQTYRGDSKYRVFKELAGRMSEWAELHYGEDDVPYLNVIWSHSDEDDPQRRTRQRDGEGDGA